MSGTWAVVSGTGRDEARPSRGDSVSGNVVVSDTGRDEARPSRGDSVSDAWAVVSDTGRDEARPSRGGSGKRSSTTAVSERGVRIGWTGFSACGTNSLRRKRRTRKTMSPRRGMRMTFGLRRRRSSRSRSRKGFFGGGVRDARGAGAGSGRRAGVPAAACGAAERTRRSTGGASSASRAKRDASSDGGGGAMPRRISSWRLRASSMRLMAGIPPAGIRRGRRRRRRS